jgi:lipoate-protein ligase A
MRSAEEANVSRTVRWLDSGAHDAATNMAIDQVLLWGALERPTVRVYGWWPAAVSLGRFQSVQDLPRELRGYPRIRRASGGGAILHRDELTYAVAAPRAVVTAPCCGITVSYQRVHDAVREALTALGVRVDRPVPAQRLAAAVGEPAGASAGWSASSKSDTRFLCFERKSPWDLTAGGRKLVGSAQRRRGEAVLQHGSIPLGAEPNAEGSTTVALEAGQVVTFDALAAALKRTLQSALEAELVPAELTPDEQRAVAALRARL